VIKFAEALLEILEIHDIFKVRGRREILTQRLEIMIESNENEEGIEICFDGAGASSAGLGIN